MAFEGRPPGVKTVKTSQLGAMVDSKAVLKYPTGIAWTSNSQFGLTVIGARGKAMLFNARTNTLDIKLDLDETPLTAVEVLGRSLSVGTQSGRIHMLDSEDDYRNMESSAPQSTPVTCMRFASSENIFVGYSEPLILLWNAIKLNKPVLQLSNHQHRLVSLDVQNSDPNIMLSTDQSDTSKVWDVRLKHPEVFSIAGAGSFGAKFLPNQACTFLASSADHSIK